MMNHTMGVLRIRTVRFSFKWWTEAGFSYNIVSYD